MPIRFNHSSTATPAALGPEGWIVVTSRLTSATAERGTLRYTFVPPRRERGAPGYTFVHPRVERGTLRYAVPEPDGDGGPADLYIAEVGDPTASPPTRTRRIDPPARFADVPVVTSNGTIATALRIVRGSGPPPREVRLYLVAYGKGAREPYEVERVHLGADGP